MRLGGKLTFCQPLRRRGTKCDGDGEILGGFRARFADSLLPKLSHKPKYQQPPTLKAKFIILHLSRFVKTFFQDPPQFLQSGSSEQLPAVGRQSRPTPKPRKARPAARVLPEKFPSGLRQKSLKSVRIPALFFLAR